MKTKAISKYNVAVTVQSGKVGNVRYVQKGGHTYVRSAANRVDSNSNPRTACSRACSRPPFWKWQESDAAKFRCPIVRNHTFYSW